MFFVSLDGADAEGIVGPGEHHRLPRGTALTLSQFSTPTGESTSCVTPSFAASP
jgi:hypothetical protein